MGVEAVGYMRSLRRPQVRNPGAGFAWDSGRVTAASGVARYVETIGLGVAIAAITGILPLVMLLHG